MSESAGGSYLNNCRACFGKKGVNISIFSHINIQGKRLCIKDLLLQYTQLEILPEDLPEKICSECALHLQNAHKFNEKCLETSKKLQRLALQSEKLSPPILKPLLGRKSNKKDIVSDNHLSRKSPQEIKILPKQKVLNAIIVNASNSDQPINPLFVIQNTDIKPVKNFGYELGLTRKSVYACTLCSRKFVSAKYLRVHMGSVHNTQSKNKCHVCDLKFETKGDLLKHNTDDHFRIRHFDKRSKFICKLCSKRFRNVSYLKKHMDSKHTGVWNKNSVEFIGVKELFETGKLSLDEDVRTSDAPIECKLCGKMFGFYKNYKIHKSTHRANVCSRCNKCYPGVDLLSAHSSSHTKDNPFFCAYCEKVFMTKAALVAHYKCTHKINGEIYFCGLCETIGEAYLCRDNLLKHLEEHDNAKTEGEFVEPVEGEKQGMDTNVVDTDADMSAESVTEKADSVHYIVVNDSSGGGEKYVEISAEQVDLLIKGELTELDLVKNAKILDSGGQKYEGDGVDTSQQDTDVALESQKNIGTASQDIGDVSQTCVSETDFAETHVIEADVPDTNVAESEDVEIYMSDTNVAETDYVETYMSDTDVAEADDVVTYMSDTNVAETEDVEMNTSETRVPKTRRTKSSNVAETNVAERELAKLQINSSTPKRLPCPLCRDTFLREFNLLRHQATAHKLFTLKCSYCPQKFNNMPAYEVHKLNCAMSKGFPKLIKKDIKNNSKEVNCPVCFVKFRCRAPMFSHMSEKHPEEVQVDLEEKKFHCLICDTKLTTSTGFSSHMQSHYGFPRYPCQACGRRFTYIAALTSHIKCKHNNHRPHQCTLCNRRFATKDHLRKHVKLTHLGQRDFLCGVCGLTFLQSSHVTQHMWKHTGIKPHKCSYCPSRYSVIGSLKKHLNRVHRDEYLNDQAEKEAHYRQLELEDQARSTDAQAEI